MIDLIKRLFHIRKKDKTKHKPKPYYSKERHSCPFYGFFGSSIAGFLDQDGNQCALITNSYSPCRMEFSGENPNWEHCQFNTEQNRADLKEITDNFRVFPKEFRPPNIEQWEGISMREWVEYVLGEQNDL